MDLRRLQYISNKFNENFSAEEIRLLTKDFSRLNANEKNQCLDNKLRLMKKDLLIDQELCILFEQLDILQRYHDILSLIIRYPRIIEFHYEATSGLFHYNIKYNWDWNLDNNLFSNPDETKFDLITMLRLKDSNNKKLQQLVLDKLFKNKNIEEEYANIIKKIFSK